MKSLTKMMAMGLLTVGLASCSSEGEDLPSQGSLTPGADNVYMALNLSIPQSRSATDNNAGGSNSNANPDVEVGVGDENSVKNLKIYLVDADNNTTIYGTGYAVPANPGNTLIGANGAYVAKFDGKDLKTAAPGKRVKVFVVCNGSLTNEVTFDKDEKFDVKGAYASDVTSAPWNPFIMSNAEQSAVITLPTANDMAYKYSNPTTPFKLGVVKVERAAARFDYMSKNSNDVYTIEEQIQTSTGQTETKQFVNVELTHMSVLNVSKKEFIFRHVGNESGVVSGFCMPELQDNYVITPDWVNNPTASLEASCWNSRDAQFKDKNSVKYLDLNAPLRPEDNWNGTEANRGDYKPMAYSSEVTSTKSPKNNQVTAIVFRGKLVPGTDCPAKLKAQIQKGEKLYAYDNHIYGSWADVAAEAQKGTNVLLEAAYNHVIDQTDPATPDGWATIITDEIVAKAGFTVYTQNPQTNAYDVYYYYENRHNDLGNEEVHFGSPMRYGVVRNNVYKLKVNKIAKYGHPFNPGGDPDPYNPDEKVDPDNVYFEVGVKVLPWTVRVNDIEF